MSVARAIGYGGRHAGARATTIAAPPRVGVRVNPGGVIPAVPVGAETQVGSTPWIVVGWLAIGIAILCAAAIVLDIVGRGYRQHMAIMDLVWPITALYWGPVALWGYFARGRRMSPKWAEQHDMDMQQMMSGDGDGDGDDDPPSYGAFAGKDWWPISKGVSHCGAGCTLGDIVGEWIVYLTAWSIPLFADHDADTLMAMFVADFTLAWLFGIVFQYFSIVPMRDDVGRLDGVWQAIKADTLSIVSFQIGLFGYMALYHLVFWQPPLSVASPVYWFMMQIGMVVGYFTAWPVNAWLIRKGVKEKM